MSASLHVSRGLAVSIGMALASSCLAMIAGMAARAGWWLLPAIGASLLIALALARAIGRLARRFPSALGVRTYVKAAFGNGVQTWLERTPWRTLSNPQYGCTAETPPPSELVREDPLLNQIHKLDIATFLTAKKVSVDGISRLVSLAPDEASRIFMATQALDEARHFEILSRRMADFGVMPHERNALMASVTTPQMKRFYDLMGEQVDRKDCVAALIAHNVILEGMAYPVYRYEIKYWSRLEAGLSQMIQGAFADEVHAAAGSARRARAPPGEPGHSALRMVGMDRVPARTLPSAAPQTVPTPCATSVSLRTNKEKRARQLGAARCSGQSCPRRPIADNNQVCADTS